MTDFNPEIIINTKILNETKSHANLYLYAWNKDKLENKNPKGWVDIDLDEVAKLFDKKVGTIKLWIKKCLNPIRKDLEPYTPFFRSAIKQESNRVRIYYVAIHKVVAAINYNNPNSSFGFNALADLDELKLKKKLGAFITQCGLQRMARFAASKGVRKIDKKIRITKLHKSRDLMSETAKNCVGVIETNKFGMYVHGYVPESTKHNKNSMVVFGASQKFMSDIIVCCTKTIKNRLKEYKSRGWLKRLYVTNHLIEKEYIKIRMTEQVAPNLGLYVVRNGRVFKKHTYFVDDDSYHLKSMKQRRRTYKKYLDKLNKNAISKVSNTKSIEVYDSKLNKSYTVTSNNESNILYIRY